MKQEDSFRKCSICGSFKSTIFLKATTNIPTKSKQIQVTEKHFGLHGDIVRCSKCGFAFVGRDPYVNKIVSLYKDMNDEAYLQEEKERRLSFIKVIKTIEKLRGKKKGLLLDIGCCTGGLLIEARSSGWEVFGVDPSVWACRMAKRLHRLEISNETIESYDSKGIKFDVITILDVLEHVKNSKVILNKVNKLLRQGGVLCIVTPDFGSITAKILRKRWWGIRLAHLSYFRYQDLQRLFDEAGFKVIKKKTYIRFFSLYYIFVRVFPMIEKMQLLKSLMKKIVIPLILFDTFELYLIKRN